MAKNKLNPVIVIIGILLVFFFLGKTGFLGSLITNCINTEPNSISELNLTIVVESLTIPKTVENGTYNNITTNYLVKKYALDEQTSIYDLYAGIDANTVMRFTSQNTSVIGVLNDKPIWTMNTSTCWKNKYNNLIFCSANQSKISEYYSKYEVCTTTQINVTVSNTTGINITTESACTAKGGLFRLAELRCYCANGTVVTNLNSCVAQVAITQTATPLEATSTSGGLNFGPPEDTRSSFNTKQKYIAAIGVLVVLILLYWFFEKGPNKGLIGKGFKLRKKK